jgi:hypothetical protein
MSAENKPPEENGESWYNGCPSSFVSVKSE